MNDVGSFAGAMKVLVRIIESGKTDCLYPIHVLRGTSFHCHLYEVCSKLNMLKIHTDILGMWNQSFRWQTLKNVRIRQLRIKHDHSAGLGLGYCPGFLPQSNSNVHFHAADFNSRAFLTQPSLLAPGSKQLCGLADGGRTPSRSALRSRLSKS